MHLYLSKYSSSLIIQLSHMTISCSCSGVLQREQDNVHTQHNEEQSSSSAKRQDFQTEVSYCVCLR